MSTEQAERRPITLIEVIIAVVVLLILLAFFLIFTVKVSDKDMVVMTCMNNLRQLGQACHNYQTTRKGRLPTGTIVDSAKEPGDRLSFLVSLLPYLEQEHVYKSLDLKQGWNAPANQPFVEKSIQSFLCPSVKGPWNRTNYVGVTGVGEDSATLDGKHPRAGAFGYERVANLASFGDGASNTLLLIETMSGIGPWAAGGLPTLRGVPDADPTPIKEGGAFGTIHPTSRWRWGKAKATANAVFVDGRVAALNADISPETLAALATAHGDDLPGDH
jgi:type II secretory pathway pseudopilin PulG